MKSHTGNSSQHPSFQMLGEINLLFHCNNDVKYLKLNDQFRAFYRNIISFWQELNTVVPKQKDVLNQIIQNKRFIKINNASVFFQNWHHAGIQHLSSLLKESVNNFLTFNSIQLKFNVKCSFVQYYGLLSAIPCQWKGLLKVFKVAYYSFEGVNEPSF